MSIDQLIKISFCLPATLLVYFIQILYNRQKNYFLLSNNFSIFQIKCINTTAARYDIATVK